MDLNYFYEVFNKQFTQMYVNINLPEEISQNFITQFYNNLEDNTFKILRKFYMLKIQITNYSIQLW